MRANFRNVKLDVPSRPKPVVITKEEMAAKKFTVNKNEVAWVEEQVKTATQEK